MTRTRSASKTPPPSPSPPLSNNGLRRSTRIASESLQQVFSTNQAEKDSFKQYSQDPNSQKTQCSDWSDNENSDLDSDSEPPSRKAKVNDLPIKQPTPKIDTESIDYGDLPLIDVWEAKGKRWTQDEVEKLPGFYKVKPRSNLGDKKQEGEIEEEDDIPISHVKCTGGPSSYVPIDWDELLAYSLAPLPDDDEDVELPSTTEGKQDETAEERAQPRFWDGELVYGVAPCMHQPLPDSEDENL